MALDPAVFETGALQRRCAVLLAAVAVNVATFKPLAQLLT
jgi:hypothetical protein